ncbi:histidine phosphatase superfamily [Aspergillus floccosus]
MQLFLIRHAETVDNVARILAGTTDSPLTTHGASQIDRLGQHFKSEGVRFTHIFASDLSRAALTAEGIRRHQPDPTALAAVASALIRERDFGSFEGQKWSTSYQSQAVQVIPETDQSIMLRSNTFINDHLLPLVLDENRNNHVVAVVSHGITLQFLWKCIRALFHQDLISFVPGASSHESDTRFISPTWANTGFLELCIQHPATCLPPPVVPRDATHGGVPPPSNPVPEDTSRPLSGWLLEIRAINSRAHLAQLRRVQGGIGSGTYDKRQRRIDNFFK